MHKCKRGLAMLLLLVLLVGMLPLQAFAEEPAVPETTEVTEPEPTEPAVTEPEVTEPVIQYATIINPLYADVLTEDNLVPARNVPMLLEDEVCTSAREAALALREAMVNHREVVVLNVESKTPIADCYNTLFNMAMEHTGRAGEGDNLRYQNGGAQIEYGEGQSGSLYTYYVKYTITYMTTTAQEAQVAAAAANLRQQLGLSSMTDVQKITAVYNWMCQNIAYDYDGLADKSDLLEYTAYDAIVNRSAVCQGYANLFYYMMLNEGIDCRIISGDGNGEPHAWNIVKIGDCYYNVDATWDANWICKYFLRGSSKSNDFNKEHVPDSAFTASSFTSAYPIGAEDYTAAVRTGSCGDSATWSLDNMGCLTVSGTGAMADYTGCEATPWYGYYMCISKVKVGDGITRIGDCAFQVQPITEAAIGKNVTTVGEYAFGSCRQLKTVSLPAGISGLELAAFFDCPSLETVVFCGSEAQWAALTVEPGNDPLTNAARMHHNFENGICTACGGTNCAQNGHSWAAADCDTPKTCTACGATEGTELGHSWAAADCDTPKTCTACGATEGTELGHSWAAADCDTPKTCTACGATEGTELGHSWAAADCDTPKTCTACGATEGTELGHNYVGGICSRCEEKDPNYVELSVSQQPVDVTVKNGATATTTVVANGEGLTYAWYFTSNAADTTFSKSSTTTATYSTTMDATRDGRRVYCVITDKYGNTIETVTVVLSMEKTPLVITRQPADVTVVNGAPARTTVQATGDGLKYTWYFTSGGTATKFSKSSGTSAAYSTTMNADRDGRQIYCVITDRYGQRVQTDTVTLSMKEAIKLVSQPQEVKVAGGETAKTWVVAEGEDLTYTWYYANKGKTRFTKSSYSTNVYSTVMDAARDGRRVYCKISDPYGNTVKTATVTLYMYTPLEITQQPVDVTVAEGAAAKATVQVNGDGLTYTWYFTADGNTDTFKKSSITSAAYSTTMDATRDGRKIYCVITDRYGDSVTTDTVTLAMKPRTPLAITQQPTSVTVANGAAVKTAVQAEGDGLKYVWYYANKGKTTFTKSSITTNTYSTTMDAARDGRKVYCKITDRYGSTVKTNTVTLSMEKTPLTIVQQPEDVTVAKGATARTTVKAEGDGLKYAWYFTSNAADTTFSKSSVTTAAYSTTMDASRDGRKVYCVITDSYGGKLTTETVTLSMMSQGTGGEELRIPELPESITVGKGKTVSVIVEARGEGLRYQWYYTTGGSATKFYLSSNTTDTYTTTMDASRDGRQIYCVITDANGKTMTTNTVTLKMA